MNGSGRFEREAIEYCGRVWLCKVVLCNAERRVFAQDVWEMDEKRKSIEEIEHSYIDEWAVERDIIALEGYDSRQQHIASIPINTRQLRTGDPIFDRHC